MLVGFEEGREIDGFSLLFGERRAAGGDQTDEGQAGLGPRRIGELNRTALARLTVDQTLLFKRFEMTHHAVRRADAEVGADVANGGPVAPVHDLVSHEIVDLALPLGQRQQLPGCVHWFTQ